MIEVGLAVLPWLGLLLVAGARVASQAYDPNRKAKTSD